MEKCNPLTSEYNYRDGKLIFPDGVSYTIDEALALSSENETNIIILHLIKKLFEGDIVTSPEVHNISDFRDIHEIEHEIEQKEIETNRLLDDLEKEFGSL